MAAAALTISGVPCTIESDTTGAVITNGAAAERPSFCGELRNHGPADAWLFVSQDLEDAAMTSDVVTTGAQGQNQIPLPAGATVKVRNDYKSIAHKTAAGTATLSWMPY